MNLTKEQNIELQKIFCSVRKDVKVKLFDDFKKTKFTIGDTKKFISELHEWFNKKINED